MATDQMNDKHAASHNGAISMSADAVGRPFSVLGHPFSVRDHQTSVPGHPTSAPDHHISVIKRAAEVPSIQQAGQIHSDAMRTGRIFGRTKSAPIETIGTTGNEIGRKSPMHRRVIARNEEGEAIELTGTSSWNASIVLSGTKRASGMNEVIKSNGLIESRKTTNRSGIVGRPNRMIKNHDQVDSIASALVQDPTTKNTNGVKPAISRLSKPKKNPHPIRKSQTLV